MSGRLNGLCGLLLAALLLPLLVSAQYLDITGTTTSNISSDSTQLTCRSNLRGLRTAADQIRNDRLEAMAFRHRRRRVHGLLEPLGRLRDLLICGSRRPVHCSPESRPRLVSDYCGRADFLHVSSDFQMEAESPKLTVVTVSACAVSTFTTALATRRVTRLFGQVPRLCSARIMSPSHNSVPMLGLGESKSLVVERCFTDVYLPTDSTLTSSPRAGLNMCRSTSVSRFAAASSRRS